MLVEAIRGKVLGKDLGKVLGKVLGRVQGTVQGRVQGKALGRALGSVGIRLQTVAYCISIFDFPGRHTTARFSSRPLLQLVSVRSCGC